MWTGWESRIGKWLILLFFTSSYRCVGQVSSETRWGSRAGSGALSLNAVVQIHSGVPEFRQRVLGNQADRFAAEPVFGPPSMGNGSSAESDSEIKRVFVQEARFELQLPLEAAGRWRARSGVPVRGLQSNTGGESAVVPEGAELGGFDVAVEHQMPEGFGLGLQFKESQSPKLQLYDSHSELISSMNFYSREGGPGGSQFEFKIGPEFHLPLRARGDVRYGASVAARSALNFMFDLSAIDRFELGQEFYFRRLSSYKVQNVDQGGAGLLGYSASLRYLLTDFLWVGLRYENSLLRPQGREYLLGDSGALGIYGSSFGMELRIVAL